MREISEKNSSSRQRKVAVNCERACKFAWLRQLLHREDGRVANRLDSWTKWFQGSERPGSSLRHYGFVGEDEEATNRFSSVPDATVSYDANGNVLTDGSHTYAWDANSTSVDDIGLTFDALDRMVEQNRSCSYTQIVYAPTGAKLALMSGQTLQKAFVQLPGRATAVSPVAASITIATQTGSAAAA